MPATETNTLTVGADGYEYQIRGRQLTYDVWSLASHFGIEVSEEEPETLLFIDVVRTMMDRFSYHYIQDSETFGDKEPRTFRQWIRAYQHRFADELPVWYQIAIGTSLLIAGSVILANTVYTK